MFKREKSIEDYSDREKQDAYDRYINALSASVRGTGSVFLKRGTEDLFTNNFNRSLMGVHKANHDIQIVVDQVIFLSQQIKFELYVYYFSMHVHSMLWDT